MRADPRCAPNGIGRSIAFLTASPNCILLDGMEKRPKINLAQLAYLIVFGIFVFIYSVRAINGTATQLDWITLAIAVFLLLVSAYRILRDFGRPDS